MSVHVKDPTKTRWYVAADLLVKILSSIGIIILGLFGWQFQKKDRAERQFLPTLQSLSELQLASASVATTLRASSSPAESDAKLNRLGLRITYLADSLVIPDGDNLAIQISPANAFPPPEAPPHALL